MTYGELKATLRKIMFPAGEAYTLRDAHNKAFLDCLIDLQTYVECMQLDNLSQFPHCSTYYNCGLTVFPAPIGNIKRVVVVEKVDSDGLADASGTAAWCDEVEYTQVDPTTIKQYLINSRALGCCLPIYLYFGLDPSLCAKTVYPYPTDAEVAAGLPTLPLGYHYPQTSTDASARARAGVWALERGKIYIAPWIQSTEIVLVTWDGIKRSWSDGDTIYDNPLVSRALKAWGLREHAKDFDHDYNAQQVQGGDYDAAMRELIHECREQTRIRGKEPSFASGTNPQVTLYYNNQEVSATATCPSGYTGNPVTVTIKAGTVSSDVSVAEANRLALEQAQAEANSRRICVPITDLFSNPAASATKHCSDLAEPGAPMPTGSDSVGIVAAGERNDFTTQAAADAWAADEAEDRALDGLTCVFHNRAQHVPVYCPTNNALVWYGDVAESDPLCDADSQLAADQCAEQKGREIALAAMDLAGTCISGGTYWNTAGTIGPISLPNCCNKSLRNIGCGESGNPYCQLNMFFNYPAHRISAATQALADQLAHDNYEALANSIAMQLCDLGDCTRAVYDFP